MHVHYAYVRTYTHVYGYVSVHYCTHTRSYGGVGFRNENVSQVENLPQLFHPHTYVTPKPIYTPSTPTYPPTPTQHPPTYHQPLKPLILPHSHYILITFPPTHAYSPTHTHII